MIRKYWDKNPLCFKSSYACRWKLLFKVFLLKLITSCLRFDESSTKVYFYSFFSLQYFLTSLSFPPDEKEHTAWVIGKKLNANYLCYIFFGQMNSFFKNWYWNGSVINLTKVLVIVAKLLNYWIESFTSK